MGGGGLAICITQFTQVKYAIECLKRIVAAMGGFGGKGAVDIEWNCFINTKGENIYLSLNDQ